MLAWSETVKSLLISYNLPIFWDTPKISVIHAAKVDNFVARGSWQTANSFGSYIFSLSTVFSLAKSVQLVLEIMATYIL